MFCRLFTSWAEFILIQLVFLKKTVQIGQHMIKKKKKSVQRIQASVIMMCTSSSIKIKAPARWW